MSIPVFAIVDTNSDPSNIDYVIPANDDATKSVDVILTACCTAIAEGLEERKAERGEEADEKQEKPRRERVRKVAKPVESIEDAPAAEEAPATEEATAEAKPKRTRKAAPAKEA